VITPGAAGLERCYRSAGLREPAHIGVVGETVIAMPATPVDLLWNGGVGTYVKASTEHDSNAGATGPESS